MAFDHLKQNNKQMNTYTKLAFALLKSANIKDAATLGKKLLQKMKAAEVISGSKGYTQITQEIEGLRSPEMLSAGVPSWHRFETFRENPQAGVDLLGNQTEVTSSLVPGGLRNKGLGLGRKMYGAGIRRAFEEFLKGGPRYFTSDGKGITSESATRLWETLKRRGYPVQPGADLAPLLHPVQKAKFGIDLENMRGFYKDKTINK